MSTPSPGDTDAADANHPDGNPGTDLDEIRRWLEQLRRSDRALYNLMAIEVWAIAQTMDSFVPGFWNRFMENRRLALNEFLAQRHSRQVNFSKGMPDPSNPSQNSDGMMESDPEKTQ
jgi:hypothetical protein